MLYVSINIFYCPFETYLTNLQVFNCILFIYISSNPQMGGNSIDELLNGRADSDILNSQDSTYQK